MKKCIYLIAFVLFLVSTNSEAATFVSVLDFKGFSYYSGTGAVDPELEINNYGENGSLLLAAGGATYYGAGALVYTAVLNLPDPDVNCNWVLDYGLLVNGQEYEWNDSALTYVLSPTHTDLNGNMALGNFSTGVTPQFITDWLVSISGTKGYINSADAQVDALGAAIGLTSEQLDPLHDMIPDNLGAMEYYFAGNTAQGLFLYGIDKNTFNNDYVEWERDTYSGHITLTAEYKEFPSGAPVPEPTTMLLLGLGLIGLAGVRRKLHK